MNGLATNAIFQFVGIESEGLFFSRIAEEWTLVPSKMSDFIQAFEIKALKTA
jgi:hypothetical protein